MFYDILDEERKRLLPSLSCFKGRFYLAGGTALALQLGHRDSEDFDFFSTESFDVFELLGELHGVLNNHQFTTTQEEKNTLSLVVDQKVKLSFFQYPYPLLEPLIKEKDLDIATITDIGCMKLSTIIARATMKDYIDLYYILQKINLSDLLELSKQKMPSLDKQLILKSLVYFEDVFPEKLQFKHGHEIPWPIVQENLKKQVQTYIKLANLDVWCEIKRAVDDNRSTAPSQAALREKQPHCQFIPLTFFVKLSFRTMDKTTIFEILGRRKWTTTYCNRHNESE